MRIYSNEHTEVVGTVPNPETPFAVSFDETGHAEVEDEAVGNYLIQLGAAVVAQPVKTKEDNEDKDTKKPEEMNPAQLKKYAKDNGIEIGEASKKDELLPIINAFLIEKQAQEELPKGGDE